MKNKNTIKQQFNLQAEKFSNWSVTRNIEYMEKYSEFCDISEKDTLLDVACGTGEYAIYCAQKIKEVCGVDLSRKMIQIARKSVEEKKLINVSFKIQDVSKLPFENKEFSIVNCKSAFHHFADYEENILEMKRCCKQGGRISVQDIIAYDNSIVNNYFEALECLIDISHNVTLTAEYITNLFFDHNIKIIRSNIVEVELSLQDYISHAVQTEERKNQIIEHINYGINAPEIETYFTKKEDGWYFKRNVFLILGEKSNNENHITSH